MPRAPAPLSIRRAAPSDDQAIGEILLELHLTRPLLAVERFWVAEQGAAIAGIAHLEPAGEHLFLSSVGVREACQGRGIATALLRRMLAGEDRPVALYTIIPEFFERLGFRRAPAPSGLPPRELFGCDACEAAHCACMVRLPQ